ncbi:MAG: hypothetical protein SFU25_01495 [Candidatus Caenarcaniphilales bacterium]|nr:hypothetical protein [Candidatus Caenarcaniphilales bacterium]
MKLKVSRRKLFANGALILTGGLLASCSSKSIRQPSPNQLKDKNLTLFINPITLDLVPGFVAKFGKVIFGKVKETDGTTAILNADRIASFIAYTPSIPLLIGARAGIEFFTNKAFSKFHPLTSANIGNLFAFHGETLLSAHLIEKISSELNLIFIRKGKITTEDYLSICNKVLSDFNFSIGSSVTSRRQFVVDSVFMLSALSSAVSQEVPNLQDNPIFNSRTVTLALSPLRKAIPGRHRIYRELNDINAVKAQELRVGIGLFTFPFSQAIKWGASSFTYLLDPAARLGMVSESERTAINDTIAQIVAWTTFIARTGHQARLEEKINNQEKLGKSPWWYNLAKIYISPNK